MLGDIKNISSICFWVTRGHKKNTMGWKCQWETLEKCQRGLNNVKKTLKDIEKNWFLFFQVMGGCQIPRKQFQQCQKNLRKF
jgi:hypothetical protein